MSKLQSITLPDPKNAGADAKLVEDFLKRVERYSSRGGLGVYAVQDAINGVLGGKNSYTEGGMRLVTGQVWDHVSDHDALKKIDKLLNAGLRAPIHAFPDGFADDMAIKLAKAPLPEKAQPVTHTKTPIHMNPVHTVITEKGPDEIVRASVNKASSPLTHPQTELVRHWSNLEKQNLSALNGEAFSKVKPGFHYTGDERIKGFLDNYISPLSTENFDKWADKATNGANKAAQKVLENLPESADSLLKKAQGNFAKIAKFFGKRTPVIGAAITAGFVLEESGKYALSGEFEKAGAALTVGLAETLGNVVGFGLGDAAREGARGAFIQAAGEKYEDIEKSGIRSIVESTYEIASDLLEERKLEVSTPVNPVIKPPSMS